MNQKIIRISLHFLSWLPLAWLVYAAFSRQLGADPQEKLMEELGSWGLIFLLACLSMTPARLLLKRVPWVAYRRLLGLYSAFYLSMHLAVYIILFLELEWSLVLSEVLKRPYITVGFSAYILLIPLMLTSTKASQKRLGKKWKRLHQLVYPVLLLGLLHFTWQSKSDLNEPLLYIGWGLVLLLARWFAERKKARAAALANTTI